ncbi:glycosyltransferase family 2 protein [Streptomyces sp. MS2A]|nr:glycosyltransferase family 2 protein [Streptomyces sp. MS2A]
MTHDIFIPFWGDPDQLMLAIDSVRAQTVPDWRLVVIDDCYPDPSARERVEAIDDDRVHYVRNAQNVGITENFRESVRRAQSTHVTIMGCDDLLRPNYLEVVTRTVAAVPDADVVQPGALVIDQDGEVVSPLVDRVKRGLLAPRGGRGIAVLRGERMATSLIRGNWLYWPSLAFRTETLRRIDFRDGFAVIQDLALLMDIAYDGGTLAYNPEVAFAYRRHDSSASQRTLLDGSRFRDEREYYALARRLALGKGWRRTARTARIRLMSRLHAITELPRVVPTGDRRGIRSALAHIFRF